MLNKILKGTDTTSQIKLEELIDEIGENPNILWYPSAGMDFRDLLEAEYRTELSPDIYFHTDYYKLREFVLGTVFNDERTTVEILEINELQCVSEINYNVNADFANFSEKSYSKPKVLLLDVLAKYNGGQTRKPVLYWYFENINFLDEVLLKFNISISHMVKVREGLGWGGNRKSISIAYAFLFNLKTQYLLVDNEGQPDPEVIIEIKNKHLLELKNFKLINPPNKRNIPNWSLKSVKVLRVEYLDELFSDESFNNNLNFIGQ
jgi:hypothetical protein